MKAMEVEVMMKAKAMMEAMKAMETGLMQAKVGKAIKTEAKTEAKLEAKARLTWKSRYKISSSMYLR